MNRRAILLCAILLASPLTASAQNVDVKVHTLENGLKVLMVPRRGDPNISAGWIAKVGSVNERPGITGIAHLFEHMMFKGTRTIGTSDIEKDLRTLAKLDSIVDIAKAELDALDDNLRMVVLSDHIRAGELPSRADAAFKPAKLGVVPIFEKLRRSGIADEYLGVLTGSLVILPRRALPDLHEVAEELHLDPDAFRSGDLPGCPGHVRIECRAGGTAELVLLVTALFARGDVRILVGTQSLLGEGWDAPTLNSLVLASNTASFMLSNQMRGRAIRIDPAKPHKVANIWHLATVDPRDRESWDALVSTFNWGFLNDAGSRGLTDLEMVARRFEAFEGISNGSSPLIEDGIARLGLDPSKPVASANLQTFAVAADRRAIAERWRVSGPAR
mgnify:CR=1 FL=1